MGPDDAADLMANLSPERAETLLSLMDDGEADDIRQLLTYEPYTAGGMMTPEAIICAADTTIAQAMALVRRKRSRASLSCPGVRNPPALRSPDWTLFGRRALPKTFALSAP